MAMEKVFEKTYRLYARSFLIISLFVPIIHAADIYVYPPAELQKERSISEEGNGTSVYMEEMNYSSMVMYPNIQAAIDAAVDGDIIYLARARWKGEGNRDLDFKGKAITLSSFNPDDPNVIAATIIDCNGTETSKHRGFYFHSGEDNNSVVCGITITNGSYDQGSGIYCQQSSPIISKCNIVSNTSRDSVIYLSSCWAMLSNCTVSDNNAYSGIYAYGNINKILIENCLIKNNYSANSCYGIYAGERVEIRNCIIEENQDCGIYGRGRTVSIFDSVIKKNGNMKNQTRGGVIGGNLVENCSIIENIGTGVSGQEIRNCFIGYNSGNGVSNCQKLTNSKIIGNGGIGITYPGRVENCVIAKNKKQGIRYLYSNSIFANCTIVENDGVGVEISSGSPTIANCIIRDNYLEQIKGVTSTTKIQNTNSYRIDHYSPYHYMPYDGIGNIDEDPNFVSEKDYHLMAGSPCVDAGTNDANFITEANDIEGSTRIIDGDGNGYAKADMGAYEYNAEQPVIAVWADRIVCLTNAGETKGKIYIKNAGAGCLNYEIVSDENWLTINNPVGTSAGEIQEVNVFIDSNNLALGDYRCGIKVYSEMAVNNGKEYWLDVHIGSLWTVPTDVNTIQGAIDLASNFDYVRVMDGNYMGTGNRDINFNGKNLIVYSQSGIPGQCIINGKMSNYGFRFNNRETEAVIDGFSFFNATDCIITDVCSSPIIRNCTFLNSGSGISPRGYSSVEVENCIFDNDHYGLLSHYNFNKIIIKGCEFKNTNIAFELYEGNCFEISNSEVIKTKSYSRYYDIKKIGYDNCTLNDNQNGVIDLAYIGEFVIKNSETKNNKAFGIRSSNTDRIEVTDCTITSSKSPYSYITNGLYIRNSEECNIKNCLFAGYDYGCRLSEGNFENCTFAGNRRGSLFSDMKFEASLKNCILWDSNIIVFPDPNLIDASNISYSDVRGGWDGIGNIDVEPGFVRPGYWDANGTTDNVYDDFWVEGDYHLKSEGWRWDSDEQEWTYDIETTSRCIDTGSPGYSLGDEPVSLDEDPTNEYGENLRIDMGYYGGTAEASMPPYMWAVLSDMDNSGRVNMEDFSYLSSFYGLSGEKLDGDLNRDAKVDFKDAAILADDWLAITSWAPRR